MRKYGIFLWESNKSKTSLVLTYGRLSNLTCSTYFEVCWTKLAGADGIDNFVLG